MSLGDAHPVKKNYSPSARTKPSVAPPANIYLLGLTYALIAAWLIGWFRFGYGYWEDDAFIHLEYARSVSEGRGFAFNGLVTYGDTSPLWVWLLNAAHLVIPDWIIAGKTLMAISIIAALSAVHGVASRLAPTGTSPQWFAALMIGLLAANPYFIYWSVSGMEAVLAIAVGLWIVWAASIGPARWRAFWLGCALGGVAPLLRPEFVFLDLVAAPFFLLRALQLTAGASIGARLVVIASGAALAAAPLAAWLIYAHYAFGTVISNTSAAKADFAHGLVILRLANVFGFGFPAILAVVAILPILAAIAAIGGRKRFAEFAGQLGKLPAAAWIIVAWSLVTCAFYIANSTYVQTRYALVFAPALTIVIFSLVFGLERKWLSYATSISAALAAFAITLAVARPFIANKAENVARTSQFAEFIRTKLPADKPVAVFSIGQIAYQSRHPIIDTGGITRPSALPFENSPALMVDWAKKEGAAYFVMDEAPGPGAVLLYEEKTAFAAWTLDRRKFSTEQTRRLWALAQSDAPK